MQLTLLPQEGEISTLAFSLKVISAELLLQPIVGLDLIQHSAITLIDLSFCDVQIIRTIINGGHFSLRRTHLTPDSCRLIEEGANTAGPLVALIMRVIARTRILAHAADSSSDRVEVGAERARPLVRSGWGD